MNKIGSWWLASYDAQPAEQMRWLALADHTQVPFRSISGKVYLTNQRLLFCPNLLDYGLGSRKWGANLDEIVPIDRQPKDGDITAIFGGGGRDRLRVTLRNGQVELFIFNNLDQTIERLREAISK